MYLMIGADLVPTESNQKLFDKGNAAELLGEELRELLHAAAYRIFNLEIPLIDAESPIEKCGPNLIAPAAAIAGYKAIRADILTLANNHILDQGAQGLRFTCKVLEENNITYLGVGETPEQAAKPHILNFGGKKIGIYACVEHEFSVVTKDSAGANPFDPLESPDHVKALKEQCDYVIVLYHGGKEHYRYPSPGLQKACRKLVEKGADLVLCQHSHCIGCEEKYLHGTIVYGQGNFLFDYSNSELWQTSLLIRVAEDLTVSYVPLVKNGNVVRLAQGQCAEDILCGFRERSQEIQNPDILREKYAEFAQGILNDYLWTISGARKSLFLRAINKLTGGAFRRMYLKKKYGKSMRLSLINYVECEAHREVILEALKRECL